jgi:hypothetical protein
MEQLVVMTYDTQNFDLNGGGSNAGSSDGWSGLCHDAAHLSTDGYSSSDSQPLANALCSGESHPSSNPYSVYPTCIA